MKPLDQTLAISALVFISPVIFSIFFLAIRSFSCYILPELKNKYKTMKNVKEINQLIANTKGKFFSLTFIKNDGTVKTVNAKDKYFRLIKGVDSPATKGLKDAGFVSHVNRNRESWFSFKPQRVTHFKCGKVEKSF